MVSKSEKKHSTTLTRKKASPKKITPEDKPAPDEPKEAWNVLIYMASDNNLKEESVYALTEMLQAKLTSTLNVAVQFDSGDAVSRFEFKADEPKVAEEVKDDSTAKTERKRLEGLRKPLISNPKILQRLSDSEMMEDFLEQGLVPDNHNIVVLSGHGSGAVGDFMTTNNPPTALSILDIRSVLSTARRKLNRKIEVLGMDSCLMSMAEVCYELREDVSFLVGSEGFSRNAGWPYRQILSELKEGSAVKPEECARMIVREYMHFYAPYTMAGISVDQSACKLENMEELKNTLLKLTDVLIEKLKNEKLQREKLKSENLQRKKLGQAQLPEKLTEREIENAILLAHWRAQSYKLEQYVDLSDFCGLLAQHCNDAVIKELCEAVVGAVDDVVLLSCYSGAAFQYSKGLSIYFPWAKSDLDRSLPFYRELSFSRDTHWGDFLAIYGEQTQREPNRDRTNKTKYKDPLELPMSVETELGLGFIEGVRTNRLEGTKTNRLEGTKGGRLVFPMVKNPSDRFLKYEDDCVEKKPEEKKEPAPDPVARQ